MAPDLIHENLLVGWNQDFGGATAGAHGILVGPDYRFTGLALPITAAVDWSGGGL